ncbi:MAG: hypothetical protein P1U30_11155, partial [Phycisphaerales bacterium]|nr:hypothetical protein [Phycisphaerales bacterium]
MCTRLFVAVLAAFLGSSVARAQLINDSFTYQGTISDLGVPADGLYDVKFTVYDDEVGGFAIPGATTTVFNIQVTDGLFEAFVDFGGSGSVFDSNRYRWLELEGKPSSNHSFNTLAPRQRITPAPVANFALRAESAEYAETSGTTLQQAFTNGFYILTGSQPVLIRGRPGSDGGLDVGGTLSDGNISIFNYDSKQTHRLDVNSNTESGQFTLFDGSENPTFQMYTDLFTGVGGTMTISRADSNVGFSFVGSDILDSSPKMFILGEAATMRFDTNHLGDTSVMLPNRAI